MDKIATFFRESSIAKFLIPLGLMLFIFGIVIFIINTGNKDYVEVESVVSNVVLTQEAYTDVDGTFVEASYDVSVKYTVDGNEYESVLSGLSKYNIGDKMTIYYNPENPNQITQTKSLILPIIMIIAGIIAFVAGIVCGAHAVKVKEVKSE